jgi:hypothetical protein
MRTSRLSVKPCVRGDHQRTLLVFFLTALNYLLLENPYSSIPWEAQKEFRDGDSIAMNSQLSFLCYWMLQIPNAGTPGFELYT